MPVKPDIKSFLIADQVIQEKGTNKWSAIGIFDAIWATTFPCIHPSLALYLRLSDAEGEYDIRIDFCDAGERILAVFKGIKLSVKNRLATPDFGIQTHSLPLPQPGRYLFRIYFNGELAQNFALDVKQTVSTPPLAGGPR